MRLALKNIPELPTASTLKSLTGNAKSLLLFAAPLQLFTPHSIPQHCGIWAEWCPRLFFPQALCTRRFLFPPSRWLLILQVSLLRQHFLHKDLSTSSPAQNIMVHPVDVLTVLLGISLCAACNLTLDCVHVQSCPTLCNATDCSPPGSCVHGISQARILEWVAISCSRGSSQPRDRTSSLASPALAGRFFMTEPPEKPLHWSTTSLRTVSDSCSLLFLQNLPQCLANSRDILNICLINELFIVPSNVGFCRVWCLYYFLIMWLTVNLRVWWLGQN